jgi:hypothetical protein
MNRAIELRCGQNQDVRDEHLKLARKLVALSGEELPLEHQRSTWLTASAALQNCPDSAVAITVHLDSKGALIPAARENGVEINDHVAHCRTAETNVMLLFGPEDSAVTLALADAMPPYLFLVSNRPTLLATTANLAAKIGQSFGWTTVQRPASLPSYLVCLRTDCNPLKSFIARAVIFARKAANERHVFIDGLHTVSPEPLVLYANDDVLQLANRAIANWLDNSEPREIVKTNVSQQKIVIPADIRVKGAS